MAAKNDITGDSIASKVPSQKFLDNFDAIFRKNKQQDKKIEVNSSLKSSLRLARLNNESRLSEVAHELLPNETTDINK